MNIIIIEFVQTAGVFGGFAFVSCLLAIAFLLGIIVLWFRDFPFLLINNTLNPWVGSLGTFSVYICALLLTLYLWLRDNRRGKPAFLRGMLLQGSNFLGHIAVFTILDRIVSCLKYDVPIFDHLPELVDVFQLGLIPSLFAAAFCIVLFGFPPALIGYLFSALTLKCKASGRRRPPRIP